VSGTRGRVATLACAAALLAAAARAQDPPPKRAGGPPATIWRYLSDSSRAQWARPLASLVIPGTGQLMGGSDRAALYLVTEALFLTRFLSLQRDGHHNADQYHDLAFSVARGAFSPAIRDTVWDYFEAMGKYVESGPFNTSAGSDLVPPTDEFTFNGKIWLLARETYFQQPDSAPDPGSPEYARALDFYRRRAIGPNFRWSWRSAAIEQDLFRQDIRATDEAYRRAREQLGLLMANHLLSAVDALISHRLAGGGRLKSVSAGLRLGNRAAPALPPPVLLRVRATF
jgi:hypothetical protein